MWYFLLTPLKWAVIVGLSVKTSIFLYLLLIKGGFSLGYLASEG
jgi:hypothetical protein